MFGDQPLRTYGADGNVDFDLGFTPPRVPPSKKNKKSATQKGVSFSSQVHVRMFEHLPTPPLASQQANLLRVEQHNRELEADIDQNRAESRMLKKRIYELQAEIRKSSEIPHICESGQKKEERRDETSTKKLAYPDSCNTFPMPTSVLSSTINGTTRVKNESSQKRKDGYHNKENRRPSLRF